MLYNWIYTAKYAESYNTILCYDKLLTHINYIKRLDT